MEMKAGKIESFDSKRGRGVLRLDDEVSIAVNFSVDACRGFKPSKGARVVAGELGPEPGTGGPFSDTFEMRAELVEPDVGAGELPTIQTFGLMTPTRGKNHEKTDVLRVPFDASSFTSLSRAFREALVGPLAFGSPASTSKRAVPKHLASLSSLCDVGRRAYTFRPTKGKPAHGSTFSGGNVADLGDVPWPEGDAGPMQLMFQISAVDAKRLGIKGQLNVFHDVAAENVRVIKCAPGTRVKGPRAELTARVLELVDEVTVFPGIIELQSVHEMLGEQLPLDVRRFWETEVLESGEFKSMQVKLAETFPTAGDLDADLVLGGFSAVAGYKRLLTVQLDAFGMFEDIFEHSAKAAIEVSFDEQPARSVLQGA